MSTAFPTKSRTGPRLVLQPATRRAIVGYLLACPAAAATTQLRRLREIDASGVAAAEQVLSSVGGLRQ